MINVFKPFFMCNELFKFHKTEFLIPLTADMIS